MINVCGRGTIARGSWAQAAVSTAWRTASSPTESALRAWVARAQADRTQGRSGGLTTVERGELARLRKENRQLRLERDVLKKATAFSACAPREESSATGLCTSDSESSPLTQATSWGSWKNTIGFRRES